MYRFFSFIIIFLFVFVMLFFHYQTGHHHSLFNPIEADNSQG